ncbi:MAG: hypothetical protein B6U72_02425 [Candidatus Altiarchaeales archaeon ex4484_2]|nr:MAG: hypothetical protein B6U72_02425 [Candidatus Altiarchaeales archaeon ex4484_2]
MPPGELYDMLLESRQFDLEAGRNLEERNRYEIVIGRGIAHSDVFDEDIEIGDNIMINGGEIARPKMALLQVRLQRE